MSRKKKDGAGETCGPAYVEVAVALPIHQTFTYSVPIPLQCRVATGMRVLVPFTRRHLTGYVLSPCEADALQEVKPILDVLDIEPLFPQTMISFFRWIADYYMHPIGEVIRCALPSGLTIKDQAKLALTPAGEKMLGEDAALTPLERDLLFTLQEGSRRAKDLSGLPGRSFPDSLIRNLENRGWILQQRELRGGSTRPKTERFVSLLRYDVPETGLSEAKKNVLDIVSSRGEVALKALREMVPGASSLIRSLERTGSVRTVQKHVYRDPFGETILSEPAPTLTGEQQEVVNTVTGVLGLRYSPFLLTGVTGSGKTEVYLRLASEAMDRNHSVLVLVPEIALMAQMERRFRSRFGERIAVLHSGLSAGERFDQWIRIYKKEAVVVIGARSAIFAPIQNIGLIIVDEEHDTSYKQESGLRYNARDLAVVRAKQSHCVVVLGSATPSLQSCYNVRSGKFTELRLKHRVVDRPLPQTVVVDLRENKDARGVSRFISSMLYEEMEKTLARNEQVLLFLNRRGFASFPVCASCGETLRCKNCDISLTLHQGANVYRCHYCGFSKDASSACCDCGSSSIKHLGMGTEKIEAAVKRLFPNANVQRMDSDTTARKGSILGILKGLRDRTIDILVGTQIVAKGHDFPNITLVGIICADLSMNFPDFRASERTFQVLAQVAGRAGRGDRLGRVILQTFNPNHFCIMAAKEQDFRAFYDREIQYRRSLNYPPFSRLIHLRISGKDEKKTRRHALAVGEKCRLLRQSRDRYSKTIEILGPIEAPIARIAGQFRWQILLKGSGFGPLQGFMRRLMADYAHLFCSRQAAVAVDVDPFSMM